MTRCDTNKLTLLCALLALGALLPAGAQAQAVQWPFAPQNTAHRIWNAYGEFAGSTAHFHEGVDIPKPDSTVVLAGAGGVIVELLDGGTPYNRLMTVGIISGADTSGWGYVHMHIGNHPTLPRKWAVGDTVSVGDTLGVVATAAGIQSHLHFEYNDDGGGYTANASIPPDLAGNPIEFLTPRTDGVDPTVFAPFNFRKGDDEGTAAATYYSETTASEDTVVTDNTDIVARAYDRFGNFAGVTNYDLNLLKIEFKVADKDGADVIPFQEAEHFSGRFLQGDAPVGRNTFDKHRDAVRTHVLYENDNTAGSVFPPLNGTVGATQYHYIVTNKDDDANLELADSTRYWDTDGKEGDQWNDTDETGAHEATNNADALFPDGLYTVSIRASGQGAGEVVTKTQRVFVNNHDETIESADNAGNTKNVFKKDEAVYVVGEGFPKNKTFKVIVVKNRTWTDKDAIPAGGDRIAEVMVTTDADGKIPATQVWDKYAPNGSPDEGYDIIVDYDEDDKFTDKKEMKVVDPLDDKDEGEAGFKGDLVDVAFVIDDTGSMGEEIGGVRAALLAHLATYPNDSTTTFQLTTFKDNVTTRPSTVDLSVIQSQVSSLFASGGGDCPEASGEALLAVTNGMNDGGRIFLATDADPHAFIDVDAVIDGLRARGIRVDVILSGSCSEGFMAASKSGNGNGDAVPYSDNGDGVASTPGASTAGAGNGRDRIAEGAIRAFSRVARETGGIYAFVPEVNSFSGSGRQRFQNIAFNIVQGGINESVGLVEPSTGPRGGSVRVTVTGIGTNFLDNTTLTVGGDGVTVSDVTVVSPIELTATLNIAADAPAGFRDVTAVTDLGGTTETALGTGAFEVVNAPTTPTVIGVTPNSGQVGQTLNVVISGINTNFDATSQPNLGSGVTVQSVTLLSPTSLRATIEISDAASVGYRNVSVQTGAEFAGENVTGPFFVAPAASASSAVITSITPAAGAPGSTRNVTVVGQNTNFQQGVSVLSFSGTGLSVSNVNVFSPTTLTATVQIDPTANPGFRDVRVTTDTEVAVLLSGFSVTSLAARQLGDVTDDGRITAFDGARALQHSVGADTLTGDDFTFAEVTGDGNVTPMDGSLIVQRSVDVIPCFPIEAGCTAAASKTQAVSGVLRFGPSTQSDGTVLLPLELTDVQGAVTALYAEISLGGADVLGVAFTLPDGWQALHLAKEGTLRIGMMGVRPLDAREVAVIRLRYDGSDGPPEGTGMVNEETPRRLDGALSTAAEQNEVPDTYRLEQNYPNPFNPTTRIRYQLPEATWVRIDVYNMLGQRVATLVDATQPAGTHTVDWNARSETGQRVTSGVYFYTLRAGHFAETRKMTLLK